MTQYFFLHTLVSSDNFFNLAFCAPPAVLIASIKLAFACDKLFSGFAISFKDGKTEGGGNGGGSGGGSGIEAASIGVGKFTTGLVEDSIIF